MGHAFFHCSVVCLLYRPTEDYMVYILGRKFFVLEASSVCRNDILQLNQNEHYVFLCLFNIMRVVYFKHQLRED